jgi:hypothetical protein
MSFGLSETLKHTLFVEIQNQLRFSRPTQVFPNPARCHEQSVQIGGEEAENKCEGEDVHENDRERSPGQASVMRIPSVNRD